MQTLQGVGWQWCTDGVVVCLQIDGQKMAIKVPLSRVWHEFATELAAAGAPMPPAVGGPQTVSGLFSGIAHAVSSVAHAVTHNAVTKAAGNVVHAASQVALHNPLANLASKAISQVPVLGPLTKSVTNLVEVPFSVVEGLAKGGRIDRVAMANLKTAMASVKQIAPYATTVLSLVPGVGQGLSAAIGAGLALASGQNITEALAAGVRSALPGGALAAAAFDVAHAAMQGKPITQIALAALPISPAQKSALVQGVSLAKDLASGKNVSQTLIDAATHQLPPQLLQAVQIGAALGHARNLQSAVSTLTHAATLVAATQQGANALAAIKSLPRGAAIPPRLTAAVKSAQNAHAVVTQAIQHAAAGHAPSSQLLTALQAHQAVAAKLGGSMRSFKPRYHTKAGASVSGPFAFGHGMGGGMGGGIHSRFHHHGHVGSPHHHRGFKARYHTVGAPTVGGIHARFVGAPWPALPGNPWHYPTQARTLYPVRMPYQTASRLHAVFAR